MSLGTDILQAVKAGGLNSPTWQPKCEANQQKKQRAAAKAPRFEAQLNELYEAFGTDQLSCRQLSERSGMAIDLVRSRVKTLMRQKRIKRTAGMMPFIFYRA